jgi:hypothetical protein
MEVINYIENHWMQIGIGWLVLQNFLKAIQDSVDSEPAGLKPPFGKLLYYMSAISQYAFLGNRPQPIGGINAILSNKGFTGNSDSVAVFTPIKPSTVI